MCWISGGKRDGSEESGRCVRLGEDKILLEIFRIGRKNEISNESSSHPVESRLRIELEEL